MDVKDNVDVMKTFDAALRVEIENVDKVMIPLLKEYLNNVRDIRMALAREVKDIINSTRELGAMTKYNNDIKEFISLVMLLEQHLTPEMIEKLRRLSNDKP